MVGGGGWWHSIQYLEKFTGKRLYLGMQLDFASVFMRVLRNFLEQFWWLSLEKSLQQSQKKSLVANVMLNEFYIQYILLYD